MKFNWGHGIFVFLTIFLLSMVLLVYFSFKQSNPLVEKEYYPKGIVYQKQIDRLANTEALHQKIQIIESDENILVIYPELLKNNHVVGTLYFYRPSDDAGDIREKMRIDTSLRQVIEKKKLMNGKYIVKMNWEMNNTEYYQEQVIHVNR